MKYGILISINQITACYRLCFFGGGHFLSWSSCLPAVRTWFAPVLRYDKIRACQKPYFRPSYVNLILNSESRNVRRGFWHVVTRVFATLASGNQRFEVLLAIVVFWVTTFNIKMSLFQSFSVCIYFLSTRLYFVNVDISNYDIILYLEIVTLSKRVV